MATIVVFANQKGGVGKSTLAILYANHLSGMDDPEGKGVLIVDTDAQKSILNQRNNDIEIFDKDSMKYEVEHFRLRTMEESEQIMKSIKQLPDSVVLIDIPGNITDNYLAPLLVGADFIICPYQYENKVLESTTTFIRVIGKLKEKIPTMKAKLVFVPNMIDQREGTRFDLENWKKCDEILSQYGTVTNKVPSRIDFKRINTYINTPKQEQLGSPCFSDLDELILSSFG